MQTTMVSRVVSARRVTACLPLLAASSLWTLAACGTAGTASDGTNVDALPGLELEEEMRIGSVDDPELGFSQIGGVVLDRDGNAFVSERLERKIRVYDPTGALLRTIGRRGGGPGEFQTLSDFGVVGDTLWVYDSPQRRITLFDRTGRMLTTVPAAGLSLPTESAAGLTIRIRPNAMREDGLFSSTYTMSVRAVDGALPTGGGDTLRVPRLVFDAAGAVVDTVGFHTFVTPNFGAPSTVDRIKIGDREYPRPQPFSAEPLRSRLDDGELIVDRALATSSDAGSFTVTRIGPEGDTLFVRSFRYRPRGYDDAVVDTMIAARVASASRGGSLAMLSGTGVIVSPASGSGPPENPDVLERGFRDALVLPGFQPPVAQHRRGEDGSYWLRREEDAAGTFRWLVLNEDGSPRGEVRVPRRLTMYWTDGEQVWGAERDEFDVPWLVKYRIVEAGVT